MSNDKTANINGGTDTLPESIEELKALVLAQQQRLTQQSHFIEQLLEQIRMARHQHFCRRSERYSLDQLSLVFNEAEATVAQDDQDSTAPGTFLCRTG